MRPLRRLLFVSVILSLLLVLTGCSSAKKRAEKAMEAQQYDEAIRNYEQALRESPEDIEAATGLKQAQSGWLSQRLIQVRMSRLGGASLESLDILLSVLAKQAEWKTSGGAKESFTQEEERGFAAKRIRQEIETDVRAALPLKAEVFLRKYRPLLTPGETQSLNRLVQEKGTDTCVSLRKERTPETPFFNHFVARYCLLWGADGRPAKPLSEVQSLTTLFGTLEFEVKPDGLPPHIQTAIRQAVFQSLTRTAWYSPQGKRKITGSLSGSYGEKRSKTPLSLVHVYHVSEPYVEYVSVEKERIVSYEERDPFYGTKTKQRTEKYFVQEPQTRYRQLEKTHRYPAWKHEQNLSISLAGQVRIGEKTLNFSHGSHSETDGIEHDENLSSIGLKPSRPQLENADQWQKKQVELFASSLQIQARQLWIDTYCAAETKDDLSRAIAGNHAALCLREPQNPAPAFVENWYLKNFGVSSTEANSVMGR